MAKTNAYSSQEEVDQVLEHLAETYRQSALAGAHLWRQAPLLAVVANGRSGWLGDWTLTVQQQIVKLDSLYVRCLDGAVIHIARDWKDTWPAQDNTILHAAASRGYDLSAWSGEDYTEGLLTKSQTVPGNYTGRATSLQADWLEDIARYRVGLVAGWESMSGKLHAASEVFVGLAGEWEGSVGSLLTSSIRAVDAQDDPEVSSLLVHQSLLDF